MEPCPYGGNLSVVFIMFGIRVFKMLILTSSFFSRI